MLQWTWQTWLAIISKEFSKFNLKLKLQKFSLTMLPKPGINRIIKWTIRNDKVDFTANLNYFKHMLACKIWLKQQVQKDSTTSCCGFTQYTYTTLHRIHSIRWAAERSFSQRCTSNRIIKMSNSRIYKRFPFHQKAIKLSIIAIQSMIVFFFHANN